MASRNLRFNAFSHTLAAGLLVAVASPLQAAFVQPDTASASSFHSAPYVAENTINGSGLSGAADETSTHAPYSSASGGNHWTTAGGTATDADITWGFSSAQTLYGMYVWNHQSNGGLASNPNYDVTLFDLTVFDSGLNVLLSLNDVSLAPDTATAQFFDFGGALNNVSSVLFEIEAIQGSSPFTGLAEVGFETEAIAVSSPATLSLIATAAFGLLLRSRRRV